MPSLSDPYADSGGDWLPKSADPVTGRIASSPDSGGGSSLFDGFLSAPISSGKGAGSELLSAVAKSPSSFTSLMGAIPSISAGGGTSQSGDSQNQQDAAFQYNGAFQVGGSGSLSQSADSGQGMGSQSNILLYAGIGVVALIALAVLVRR